jgi:hypothetical protein
VLFLHPATLTVTLSIYPHKHSRCLGCARAVLCTPPLAQQAHAACRTRSTTLQPTCLLQHTVDHSFTRTRARARARALTHTYPFTYKGRGTRHLSSAQTLGAATMADTARMYALFREMVRCARCLCALTTRAPCVAWRESPSFTHTHIPITHWLHFFQ